ncbi:OmpH family outer membrane protein [Motiliproteus sp.]|uniref:OmpH family outer membrane protein n=1 Tax=Motiliproteus sp. TaxID=1898955 RepID=UPI003BADAF13
MKALKTVLLAVLLMPGFALAETKIAVLDMEAAISATKQAGVLREKMKQEFSAEEDQLRQLSEEGNALKAKLKKESSFLSDADRRQLLAQIQKKFQEFQTLGNQLKQQRLGREQAFLTEMRPQIETILKELVQTQEIDIILNRKGAVYVDPKLDLTPVVAEELNKL